MIHIEPLRFPWPDSLDVEMVERKGLGHPDSICDGVGEAVSVALSKAYLDRYGVILHHNVDKVTLVAGRSNPKFGGGEILKPIYLLVAGRATGEINGKKFPVTEVAFEAARNYLRDHFLHLDAENGVDFDVRIGEGSADLKDLFKRGKIVANDTSFGVGFYPYTDLEDVVLGVEEYIRKVFRDKELFVGEDIKVMGFRKGNYKHVIVAVAFVDSHVNSLEDYIEKKERLKHALEKAFPDVEFEINTADDIERGVVYLTVTGLSAENGDDGALGRGNRASGLITPYRPMSIEAVAGKNPVNHVGKLYNVMANLIARQIWEEKEQKNYVWLLSKIGHPVDDPKVYVQCEQKVSGIKDVVEYWLENVSEVTKMIIEGRVMLF